MYSFFTKVVGVTFENRQEKIIRLLYNGRLQPGTELMIKRDIWNNVDPNAIGVYTMEGEQLGFLGRDLAHSISQSLYNGTQEFSAFVSQVSGGYGSGNFGINIRIECHDCDEYDRQKTIIRKSSYSRDEDDDHDDSSIEDYVADNFDGNWDLFESNMPDDC